MAIIKKYNKENGTTYVYDSVSYWDKEKQQPRSKRKLIGKLDPVTGEIIPTGGRGRKAKKDPQEPIPEQAIEPSDAVTAPSEKVEDTSDYKQLYIETRRILLEKEASLASMESTIAQLTREKQELVSRLEQLLKEYKR